MGAPKPITLSSALEITSKKVFAAGVIDVTLNCDTNLFVDPLLMRESSDKLFAKCAHNKFIERFELVIRLLQASKAKGDKADRAAHDQLSFPEIRYTHLGFSKGAGGAGFGRGLTTSLVDSAKQVLSLGADDPDLFLALSLFEENVGPDRIGDMTTNIIIECLSNFNVRAAKKLGLSPVEFKVGRHKLPFPRNPIATEEPLILVPKDIVRQLPVASDWDSIRAAAKMSADYRRDVNNFVGSIWAAKTKAQKKTVKNTILRSKDTFEELLELLRTAADQPYDVQADVAGELYPSDLEQKIASSYPLDLTKFGNRKLSLKDANQVVEEIIKHFQHLVESNGIWREMWLDDLTTARLEKAMQRIFFVTASAFCKSNNLDLSPEADAGAGPVDFKISASGNSRVLVEIKRSMNSHLITGYSIQLETYKRAEKTMVAHYVIVDVGQLTQRKRDRLKEAHDNGLRTNGVASKVWIIDASVRESASKRKRLS